MKQIELSNGDICLVDDCDFEWLNKYKWHAKGKKKYKGFPYASTKIYIDGKRKDILMHRMILQLKDPQILCDHIDRNKLNNQRINLRISSYSGNSSNTTPRGASKYLGVSVMSKGNSKLWRATITKANKNLFLGTFPYTEKGEMLAALRYNEYAKILHGEFANLNTINIYLLKNICKPNKTF